MKYVSIPHGDLGGSGIDALSSEDSIQEGFAEDLVNAEASPQGYIAKRTGYQQIFGQLPMRAVRAEYNALDPDFLRLMLPANVNMSYIKSDRHSRPIVVSGRTSESNSASQTGTIQQVYDRNSILLESFTDINGGYFRRYDPFAVPPAPTYLKCFMEGDTIIFQGGSLPTATPAYSLGVPYTVHLVGTDGSFYLTAVGSSTRPTLGSAVAEIYVGSSNLSSTLVVADNQPLPEINSAISFFSTETYPFGLNPAQFQSIFYVISHRTTSGGAAINGFQISSTKGGTYYPLGYTFSGTLSYTVANGDFSALTSESRYYSEFQADSRKLIGQGASTTEIPELEHGLASPFMWVGVAESLDNVKLDNEQVIPAGYLSGGDATAEGIAVSSADRTVRIRQTNNTNTIKKQFVYWKSKVASAGSVYISPFPDLTVVDYRTWVRPGTNNFIYGEGGYFEHNLTTSAIQVKAFEIVGEDYREIRPDLVRVTQAGRVIITIKNNNESYFPVFFILSTVDSADIVHDINVPAGTTDIEIAAPVSPFMFASCYCDGAVDPFSSGNNAPALELIWPESIKYDSATNKTIIKLKTAANVSRVMHVYWEPAYLSTNILKIPTQIPANIPYLDNAPQLTIWGLDQAQAYSEDANPHAGWVSHLDTYRSAGLTEIIAGLGGNLFSGSELTSGEKSQYKIPTLYPSLRSTVNVSNFGPAFVDIAKVNTSTRTSGVLGGTGWDSGFADIASIAYVDDYWATGSAPVEATASGSALTSNPMPPDGSWISLDYTGPTPYVSEVQWHAGIKYWKVQRLSPTTFQLIAPGIATSGTPIPAGTKLYMKPIRGVMKVTLTAAQIAKSASFTIQSSRDRLQIQNSGISAHNGSWPILDIYVQGTGTGLAEITILNEDVGDVVTENPELLPPSTLNRTTIWDINQGGRCGIFSGTLLPVGTSGEEFLDGDVIQHANLTNNNDIVVTSVTVKGIHVDNFYEKVTFEQDSLIVASRTGPIIPLRDSNQTPTAANLITNDNLQISGFTRQFKAKNIATLPTQYIYSITRPLDAKTATVVLSATGSTTSLARGDKLLLTRAEQFSGEIEVADIVDDKTFTFETAGVGGSIGPFSVVFHVSDVPLESGPVLVGNTVWVGESITWQDTFNSTNSIVVPGRWIPLEAPEHSNNAAPTSYTRYLSNSAYDNQPILRSTQVSDSLFLTNGDDRTLKVDGSSIVRPGLPRWQPQLFFNQATNLQSYNTQQGTIPLIKTTVNVTGWNRNYFNVAAADVLAFTVGTRIRRSNDPLTIYTVQGVQGGTGSSTINQIIVDKDITDTSSADTITNVCTFSYYFRLNLIDANDNVIASAPTGAYDCTINVTSNFQNRIKLIGLPVLDIYDYDRIEIQIYRTKQNGVAPYYLLSTLAVPFDRNEGYITWIDTVADADITQQDLVNVPLKGSELGTGWSPPVRSKHITSAANRLVLGNLTSDPYIDLSIRNIGSTVTSSQLDQDRFLLRKSNTDTGTETDMVSRIGYQFTTNGGIPITLGASNAGSGFSFFSTSGFLLNLAAGDWVYLYRPSLTSLSLGQAAVNTTTNKLVLSNSAVVDNGRPFVVTTSGLLPPSTPALVANQTYYVSSSEVGAFRLCTTPNVSSGVQLDFTVPTVTINASITGAMTGVVATAATSSFTFTAHSLSVNDPVTFTAGTLPVSTFSGVTNTTGTASIFQTTTPHKFTQNQKIQFTATTYPVGTPNLAPNTNYYVNVLTTTTFNITAAIGGAVLGFSTAGVGLVVDPLFVFNTTNTYYVQQVIDANTFTLSDTVGGPVHPFNTTGSGIAMNAAKRLNTFLFDDLTAPADFAVGKAFNITGVGAPPGGLTIGTTYYVTSVNGLAFTCSLTPGGTTFFVAENGNPVTATNIGVGTLNLSTPNPSPAFAGWWQVSSVSAGSVYIDWPGVPTETDQPPEDQITYMITANQTLERSLLVEGIGIYPGEPGTRVLTPDSGPNYLSQNQRVRLAGDAEFLKTYTWNGTTKSYIPLGTDLFAAIDLPNRNSNDFSLLTSSGQTVYVDTTDNMQLQIPNNSKDVPIYLGVDFNYQTANGQPSSTGAGIENLATRRWAAAANATQRMTNTALSAYSAFSPWIVANAGGEYADGQIVFTQPMNQTTTLELVLPESTQYSMFVNGLERGAGEQVQAREDYHPSRILISYPNFAEIFDSPFATTDSQSDSAIDVNPADGQEITAVIPFFGASAFGAALKDAVVVVFKSNSIYVVNLGAKAAGQVAVQKIESQGIGCTAPYSVSVVRDGIMFANESGVYKLRTDLSVYYIGRHLQSQWRKRINKQAFSLLFGHNWAFGSQYKISVPTGTSDIPNEAYVYNSTREYTVDGNAPGGAREGSWVRHTGFNAIGWCNLGADAFQANTRGQVLQLRQTGEVFDWRDDESPVDLEILLRSMDFGDDGVRKSIPYAMITYRNPPAQGDRFGTQVTYTTDMQDVFDVADVTVLANRADTEGTSDLGGPRIITLRYSFGNKRGIRFQLRILNSVLDENVELTRIRYSVAGLNLKGILQAAQSPKTTG